MHLLQLPVAVLCLVSQALAHYPASSTSSKPLPLLIWHGLGDRHDAEGLHSVGDLVKEVHPGTHVHYIRIDDDGNNDRTATFFGNLTEQLDKVCTDLTGKQSSLVMSQGKHKGLVRVDAMGFSQGGQFLRGLVERCEGVSVRSLVTFGSQHNGIAEFQACGDWDFLCKGAGALLRGNAFTEYAQGHVVPAQYYRTVNETTGQPTDDYLTHSNFLADVNNERRTKNATYARRLALLDRFVMFVFEDDTTVIPKESGWFAEVNTTSQEVTLLRDRAIYKDDWIGLKKLDARGGLIFKTTPGRHMALDDRVLIDTFEAFFGPEDHTVNMGLLGRWRQWRASYRPRDYL